MIRPFSRGPVPLSVLTPVRPGHSDQLEARLAELRSSDPRRLDEVETIHYARFVLLREFPQEYDGAPFPPAGSLQPHQLLFTATCDATVTDTVHRLWSVLQHDADDFWGLCLGYPGWQRRDAFAGYLLDHELKVYNFWRAYEQSVPEVLRALDIRKKHAQLAREVNRGESSTALAGFKAMFGEEV